MEGVGDDFDSPNQTGPQVLLNIQLEHAEHQATHANEQPDPADIDHELVQAGVSLDHAEQVRFQKHKHGRSCPNSHQNNFALDVVAHFDFFFEFVGGLVHVVVTLRLKKEVTGLAAGHGHQPSHQGGDSGVDEQHHIGSQEGQGANQV